MSALPPISVPSIASPLPAPGPARSSYNSNSSYQSASPSASSPYSPDFSSQNSQSVGSGQALLSLSPVTTVEGKPPHCDPVLSAIAHRLGTLLT